MDFVIVNASYKCGPATLFFSTLEVGFKITEANKIN